MDSQVSEKYAICVGINQVPGIDQNEFAEKDASDVHALLQKMGFKLIEPLLGDEVTYYRIREALGDVLVDRARRDDLVIFYYAGHGVPVMPDGKFSRSEVFMTAFDYDRSKIQTSKYYREHKALSFAQLRKTFFSGTEADRTLFLFDSCFSGDFFKEDKGAARGRNELQVINKGITAQFPVIENPGEMVFNGKGKIAICSSAGGELSWEDPLKRHGRFTGHLLDALSGSASEAREQVETRSSVTVSSLYKYLEEKMGEQRPVIGGYQEGDIELVTFPDTSVDHEAVLNKNKKLLLEVFEQHNQNFGVRLTLKEFRSLVQAKESELKTTEFEEAFEDLKKTHFVDKKGYIATKGILLSKLSPRK